MDSLITLDIIYAVDTAHTVDIVDTVHTADIVDTGHTVSSASSGRGPTFVPKAASAPLQVPMTMTPPLAVWMIP